MRGNDLFQAFAERDVYVPLIVAFIFPTKRGYLSHNINACYFRQHGYERPPPHLGRQPRLLRPPPDGRFPQEELQVQEEGGGAEGGGRRRGGRGFQRWEGQGGGGETEQPDR